MSDGSDDEFDNNYGPTTPAPPPKKAPRQRAGSAKPVAGPSKPASKTVPTKRPAARADTAISLEDDEDPDIVMVEPSNKKPRDAEETDAAGPAKAAGKKAPSRNGAGAQRTVAAKGKARADPPPQTNGADEAREVDQHAVVEVEEDEPPPVPPVQRGNRGGGKQAKVRDGVTTATARQSKAEERLAREAENLRAQLEQARESTKEIATQRDRLAGQLEEVFRIRHSEAEQALSEYKAHFDESLKRKESLIQELTERLTKLQTPGGTHTNQTFNLHFLTREAADEEKRHLLEEITRLKDLVKQRDAWLSGRDQQIVALRDETVALKQERDAEIERARQLAARIPGTVGQSKPTSGELKNSPVIAIYEDLTNVLITSMKEDHSDIWPELVEQIMQCVYTYNNPDEKITFSLNFSLRNIFDRPDDYPKTEPIERDKLIQKILYSPNNLELESSELTERLGVFKSAFMFSREQMAVFLKTLTDAVTGMFETDEPGQGDSSEVIELG